MNLIQSLAIIFIIILLGLVCQKNKIFNETQVEGFELFLFKIAIPCYLFTATSQYELSTLLHSSYMLSYLLSFLVIAIIVTLYSWRNHTPFNIGIRVLASGYVNASIYTLPVITFLLGNSKAGIISNLIQVTAIQPVLLIILSLFKNDGKSILTRLLALTFTPLILMPIIGLSLNYCQLSPPVIITNVIKNIGNGASSMALLIFGMSLSTIQISKKNLSKDLLVIILTKNIFHPIVAFLIGSYIFNLTQYWLHSLIIATSAPTGFIVYLMSKQFSENTHLVQIVIAVSSVLSLVTLCFITWIIK